MDIVICTDNNYIMPSSVLISSFEEHNNTEANTIHVISDVELTEKSKSDLSSCITNMEDSIRFYKFDIRSIKELAKQKIQLSHLSIAAFLKLYIHRVLPDEIKKVLYLDGDMLITDSLSDLWNTDIASSPLAVVEDADSQSLYVQNAILYEKQYGYFNSGVMLINLPYWRKNNVEEGFIVFASEHPESLVCADQDVFNFAFHKNKITVHTRYNVQYDHYKKTKYCATNSSPIIQEAIKSPAIIHFTSVRKPWFKYCDSPNAKKWILQLKKTPYRDYVLKGNRPFFGIIHYYLVTFFHFHFLNKLIKVQV